MEQQVEVEGPKVEKGSDKTPVLWNFPVSSRSCDGFREDYFCIPVP